MPQIELTMGPELELELSVCLELELHWVHTPSSVIPWSLSDEGKYHHVNIVSCGFMGHTPSSIELSVCKCCSLAQWGCGFSGHSGSRDDWLHL